jgi:hypothetical protein
MLLIAKQPISSSRIRRPGSYPRPATVIGSPQDLEKFLNNPHQLFAAGRISLDLENIDPGLARYFETRLNRFVRACGCKSGAVAAVIALASYVTYLLVTTTSSPRGTLAQLLWGGVAFLTAAILGKLLGLLRARTRLVRELEHLAARLQDPALLARS